MKKGLIFLALFFSCANLSAREITSTECFTDAFFEGLVIAETCVFYQLHSTLTSGPTTTPPNPTFPNPVKIIEECGQAGFGLFLSKSFQHCFPSVGPVVTSTSQQNCLETATAPLMHEAVQCYNSTEKTSCTNNVKVKFNLSLQACGI